MPLFTPDQEAAICQIIDTYYSGKKKRIPELTPFTTYGDLSLLDRTPVWMNAVDKTVWADLITLKALLTTGGSGSIAPAIQGDTVIHIVTSVEASGNTVVIPELAGKTFMLRLEGRPVLPSEFEILNAGGFKMKDVAGVPYELAEGQRFDLQVYELQSVPTGGPASLSSSFVIGKIEISSNTSLNGVNDSNKIINIRAASAKIAVTLPDIASTPTNAVFIIESQINNQFQAKIQSTSGQAIYMNNSSRTALWLGKGETVWLFRNDDGWIVINDFGNYYKNIGKPYAAYSVEDNENEIGCDSSPLLKADYPRLWEKAQTLGTALTNDPAVYTANPGMWLDVDTNTFQLPDLQKAFLRGIDTGEFAGRLQDEAVNISTNVKGVKVTGVDTIGPAGLPLDNINGPSGQEFDLDHVFDISPKQGTETRPQNTGVMWVVKY